jgi:uncharacterized coiled-coil DUF342 family protein
LSKPIPRVDKPNDNNHKEEIQAINSEIDALKEKKQGIQDKIDEALDGNRNSESSKQRDELMAKKKTKGSLINEKKAIFARLSDIKKQSDSIMNDRKAAKANIKFNDLASIEKEINKLKNYHETSNMSLSEEKRLIKEIEALQSSKNLVAELKNKDANLDDVKEQRKQLSAQLTAKDKEIDAVQVEITEIEKILDALRETEKEARGNVNGLKADRDTIKAEMKEKMDLRSTVRQAFREANDKWFDYQRALKAQRKLRYEEEQKEREEEKQAYLKKKEEEEMKKIPYEEEMALCEYLADYLSKTYLSGESKKDEDTKKKDVVAVTDDPFAGFKPVSKKTEDTYFQTKGKKKPRVRQSKINAPPVFKLNVDSFEQFGLLNLVPPTKLEMVQASVDELRAKKEWFSKQPRGSVPTAQEIRKANEKAAAKLRQGDAPKKGKKDVSGDDFTPLTSTATTTTVNATWGQKSDAPAATEEADAEVSESA